MRKINRKMSEMRRWISSRWIDPAGRKHAQAYLVVLHAKWKKSRGRHSSMRFDGIANPRLALEAAKQVLRHYESTAGDHISGVLYEMVYIANLIGMPVDCEFNGIDTVAIPGDDPERLFLLWQEESERRRKAFWASPEGQALLKQMEEQRLAHQTEIKRLEDGLDSVDFSDIDQVIGWIEQYAPHSDCRGTVRNWPKIVYRLVRNGFVTSANCNDEFDGNDKENYARWIIGQAMSMLLCKVHAVHPWLVDQIALWKNNFPSAAPASDPDPDLDSSPDAE